MSLILEALKKSEREREERLAVQQGLPTSGPSATDASSSAPAKHSWGTIAGAATAIAVVGGIAGYALIPEPKPMVITTSGTTSQNTAATQATTTSPASTSDTQDAAETETPASNTADAELSTEITSDASTGTPPEPSVGSAQESSAETPREPSAGTPPIETPTDPVPPDTGSPDTENAQSPSSPTPPTSTAEFANVEADVEPSESEVPPPADVAATVESPQTESPQVEPLQTSVQEAIPQQTDEQASLETMTEVETQGVDPLPFELAPAKPTPPVLVVAEVQPATPEPATSVPATSQPIVTPEIEVPDLSAAAHYQQATALEQDGLLDRALAHYTAAMVKRPDFAEAIYGRAWVQLRRGAYEQAVQNFDDLIDLNPTMAPAHFGRGWANELMGNKPEAVRDYSEAIRLAPNQPGMRFNRAILKLYSEDYIGVETDLQAIRANGGRADQTFAEIWLFVSRARSGVPLENVLSNLRQTAPTGGWPGSVLDYMLGKTSLDEVLAETASENYRTTEARQCIAYYFAGQLAQLQGNQADAANYYRLAVATDATAYRQYWAARLELDRMGIAQ